MPSYKLTYFPVRGRAELTRQLFAQAGVKYEDVRVEKKDWPTLKPRQYGKNALEAALIDSVVYAVHDVGRSMLKLVFSKDEDKEAAKKEFSEAMQKTTKTLETMLTANQGGNGFMVGDKPTMADIHLHAFFEGVLERDAKALDDVPKLKALYERVHALPNIKAWVAKRPKTDM